MTFRDNYKDQINSIKPDRYVKAKIQAMFVANKAPQKKPNRAFIGRVAACCILCVALVCSAFVLRQSKQINQISKAPTKIKTEQNYDKIFNTIKKLKMTDYPETETGGTASSGLNTGSLKGNNQNKSSPTTDKSDENSHSKTTTQVSGVDEADIVKTDGKYIYSLKSAYYEKNQINIINPDNGKPVVLSTINSKNNSFSEMYLIDNRLIIIGIKYNKNNLSETIDMNYNKTDSVIEIYDISNPESPKHIQSCFQSGCYSDSRLIGDKVYLISNYNVNSVEIKKDSPETFVPCINSKNYSGALASKNIKIDTNCNSPEYTVICAYDIKNGDLCSTQSVLGNCFTVYCSLKNIITVSYDNNNDSSISRFQINNGKIIYKATSKIKGTLLNQFSIDEYNNNFNFVTSVSKIQEKKTNGASSAQLRSVTSVVVLDSNLKQMGLIDDIAPDEQVRSVRFMGKIAYFVTFRQVDPLFSVDLSNPSAPKIIGSLKIPGFSEYLAPFGDGKLLGIGSSADETSGKVTGMKLSMFDISNPSNVKESSKTPVDANYSDALNNHKACLTDESKNIIAFSLYDNIGTRYVIFSYKNNEFIKQTDIRLKVDAQNTRGIYINNIFYIVSSDQIISLDMNNFKEISKTTI